MVSTETKPASKPASTNTPERPGATRKAVSSTPTWVFLLRRAVVGLVVVLVVLWVFFLVDRITSRGEIARRVAVAGVDVGGMTREEAGTVLRQKANEYVTEPIDIQADKETFSISPSELDADIDVESAVNEAMARRRGWSPINWMAGFFSTEQLTFEGVSVSAEKVGETVGPALQKATVQPRNAHFQVSEDGQSVAIVPSAPGFGLDLEAALSDIRAAILATGDARRAIVPLSELEPDRTTEEAQAMGIVEPIASFTTNFPAGEERVKNIRRISEILDDTAIPPGERFSVNEIVGERTLDKGFVVAPVIYDGEYKDDIGGGVSQYATTLYNAAWFAGVPIKEHKAHSFYLSRYPLGREATLSYPHPDLVFENDYETHLLLKSSVGESSVTVTLYGKKDGREVGTETGEPYDFKDPQEVRRKDETLRPGTEKVTQKPKRGYSVDVTRTIEYADGRAVEQKVTTVYIPQNKIILHNVASTPSTTTPSGTATTAPSTTAPAGEPVTPPPAPAGG